MKLTREIKISEAFDKRHKDPSKNYGIGACNIWFIVKGSKGAITLNIGTNWFLPSTVEEYKTKGVNGRIVDLHRGDDGPVRAWAWDVHSKKKMYDGQTKYKESDIIKGGCYCGGSCLRADRYLTILLEKGSEGVFEELEKDYKDSFRGE